MTSGNKTKPWQDEETLRRLYHNKRMSMQEIADHFDNSIGSTVTVVLRDGGGDVISSESESVRGSEFNITVRTGHFARKIGEIEYQLDK